VKPGLHSQVRVIVLKVEYTGQVTQYPLTIKRPGGQFEQTP
jgi:hypothetical protein